MFRPWDGSPCYIGKGKGSRWLAHERYGSSNQHLARIITKAGRDLPKVKIRSGLTESEAFQIERAFIAAIGRGSAGPLVNMTDGGEGFTGGRHSHAYREAVGARTRGKRQNPAHTEKIRVALAGVKRGPLSAETKRKISISVKQSQKSSQGIPSKLRGRSLTAEHREKVRLANLGVKRSPAMRAAMSAGQRRRFANSLGKVKPWAALKISRRTWYRQRSVA